MRPSMHRRTESLSALKGAPVALVCQRLEEFHHRPLGRIGKAFAGQVLRAGQQFLGIGHFWLCRVHAVSLQRLSFSGIPIHLSRVETP